MNEQRKYNIIEASEIIRDIFISSLYSHDWDQSLDFTFYWLEHHTVDGFNEALKRSTDKQYIMLYDLLYHWLPSEEECIKAKIKYQAHGVPIEDTCLKLRGSL